MNDDCDNMINWLTNSWQSLYKCNYLSIKAGWTVLLLFVGQHNQIPHVILKSTCIFLYILHLVPLPTYQANYRNMSTSYVLYTCIVIESRLTGTSPRSHIRARAPRDTCHICDTIATRILNSSS